MILKHPRGRLPLIIGLVLAVLISLVTISTEQIVIEIHNTYEKLMTNDLGFSNWKNLVTEDNHETNKPGVTRGIFALLATTPKIISYKLNSAFENKKTERIDIDIKFKEYRKLLADRDKAIKLDLLTNPVFVRAKLRFKNKTYKAKIRIKGDLDDHWASKYRMSLRVNLKGKNTILGYKKFSIHKPRARLHPYDQTFQELVRLTGNISSTHQYAHVYVNGTDWGTMNIEEHITKELLEKQKRKDSVVVKFSGEKKWEYERAINSDYPHYRLSDPRLFYKLYSENKYLKKPIHRKWLSYILEQRLQSENTDLYSTDKYSRVMFLSAIWNYQNSHGLYDSNSRHYFNPYNLKLEPISTDHVRFNPIEKHDFKIVKRNIIYGNLVRTPEYYENMDSNLNTVKNALSQTSLILDKYHQYFPLDVKLNAKIVLNNLDTVLNNKASYLSFKNVNTSPGHATTLNPPSKQQAASFLDHVHARHYENGIIDIFNLIPDKLLIKNILLDNQPIKFDEHEIKGYSPNSHIPHSIQTDITGINDSRLSVETVYKNHTRITRLGPTLINSELKNPLADPPSTTETPLLIRIKDNKWKIPKGKWKVSQPIIVTGDLVIDPGTQLTFGKNAYLIVKGTLLAIGTENSKIFLGAIHDSWKGIYVIGSKTPSFLQHVVIKNTRQLQDGLLHLSGGTTFYQSDVVLQNVSISASKAEDALNIVDSSFLLMDVNVELAISDGFDSDHSEGAIYRSHFRDIGGDAIDFSGSNVVIHKLFVTNVKDKALSVGEQSDVTINRATLENVGVGIVSKDGSKALIRDSMISSYVYKAGMSYVKKDFYSKPDLRFQNCTSLPPDAYLRQKETGFLVDNIPVTESDLNVKQLYKKSIMRK